MVSDAKIAAAKKIAVFKTANLSHGVYVLSRLVALAASLLDGFDVNVTETHHKKKLDAPSGTAKVWLFSFQMEMIATKQDYASFIMEHTII